MVVLYCKSGLATNQYWEFKEDPTNNDYASECRRIAVNRLRFTLETWGNTEHPLMPKGLLELMDNMEREIKEEKLQHQSKKNIRIRKPRSEARLRIHGDKTPDCTSPAQWLPENILQRLLLLALKGYIEAI